MMKRALTFWRGNRTNPAGNLVYLHRDSEEVAPLSVSETGVAEAKETPETFNLLCDIEEEDDRYLLKFDLPGMRREDLKVEANGNRLIISARRKRTDRRVGSDALYERVFGNFSRSFLLPNQVTQADIESTYIDGVLTVTVPKKKRRVA